MERSRFIRSITNVGVWVKGLIRATISAAAGAITANLVAPDQFNFETGLPKLLTVAGAFAIVGAANYLSESPLPE